MTTLPAALKLAVKGFQVFPVWGVTQGGSCTCGREKCKHLAAGKPGKRPAIRRWSIAASNDPQTVQNWWTRHPQANIGIHTKGLLVIDVDGPEGHKSLERLQRIGKLPETATIRSGNTEPWHYQLLYRLPQHLGRIKNKPINHYSTFAPLSNIDIRTTLGCVIGPGSRHHRGGLYHWDDEPRNRESLAKAPFWLVSLLAEPPEAEEPSHAANAKKCKTVAHPGKRRSKPVRGKRHLAAKDIQHYANQMAKRFPVRGPGTRNNQMTLAVASLMGRGLHSSDVSRIMNCWLRKFQAVFATPFKQARAELADCIGRTLANPRFQSANHASARDRIKLRSATHRTLSRQFKRGSLDWMFVEALLVMFHYPPTLTDDGNLRATHADWKRIIKTRHDKSIDNQQIARLKSRYVTSVGRRAASKMELLVELQKGGRTLGSGSGRPSVYSPTGLREFLPASSFSFDGMKGENGRG